MLTLVACGTAPPVSIEPSTQSGLVNASIEELLQNASSSTGAAATSLRIQAVEQLLSAGLSTRARVEAQGINNLDNLPEDFQIRAALVRAELALQDQQADEALRWLSGTGAALIASMPESQTDIEAALVRSYYLKLGNTYEALGDHAQAAIAYIAITTIATTTTPQSNNDSAINQPVHNQIWDALNQLDDIALDRFASTTTSYEARGWIELARVIRAEQFSIKSQLDSITRWQRIWSQHSASTQLPSKLMSLQQTWDRRPKHIALILPLQTATGNAIQEGFFSAYYQSLSISREVPRISVYDSSNLSIIYPLYDEAVASGADLIIGPLDKALVNQLQQLDTLPVPTLALNYADQTPSYSQNLMQFGLAPEDEILQAANLAWEAGHINAAIITPQSDDYMRFQTAFTDIWNSKGGSVVSRSTFGGGNDYADVIKRVMAIDSSEARADSLLDILPRTEMEFTPRRRQDIDFIFLMANPVQGRQIKPTLAFYFAGDVPVYATPSIYEGSNNQAADQDLDGIVFTIEPWVLGNNDPLKAEVASNLRPAQGTLQRLRAMGIDSFRLYPRLQQFSDKDIDSLQGATGKLSMSDNGIIHRNLEVARFVDGIATAAASANSDAD